jgi:hypothetical protein
MATSVPVCHAPKWPKPCTAGPPLENHKKLKTWKWEEIDSFRREIKKQDKDLGSVYQMVIKLLLPLGSAR